MQFHFKNFKKKFSAFKFSPKLWDKPTRTALGPLSAPVVYADVFRARQLYDKLCARHLGV